MNTQRDIVGRCCWSVLNNTGDQGLFGKEFVSLLSLFDIAVGLWTISGFEKSPVGDSKCKLVIVNGLWESDITGYVRLS